MFSKLRRLVLVALASLVLPFAASSGVGPPQRPPSNTIPPAKGVFLVAGPSLTDGPFSQSVVLLLDHGEDGTLGVIINRATKIRLSEVLPELPGGKSHELFFGGPVGINGLLFVFRGGELPKGANHVMGDVYFSADKEVLDKLLEQRRRAEELHLYLGYAGWASGQLDWEISRGSWQLLRADARTVFEKDPETIWPDLVEDKSRKLIADGRLLE